MNIVNSVCVTVLRFPVLGEEANTAAPQIPPALCTVEHITAHNRTMHSPLLPHTLRTHPAPTHTPPQLVQWRQQHRQHLKKTKRGESLKESVREIDVSVLT